MTLVTHGKGVFALFATLRLRTFRATQTWCSAEFALLLYELDSMPLTVVTGFGAFDSCGLWDNNAIHTEPPVARFPPYCEHRSRYIRYAGGSEKIDDHQTDPIEWINLVSKEMSAVHASLIERLKPPLPKTNLPQLKKTFR